ncbi:MAG: TonB-dependent receptor [Granulosicoccaceae bacterium]|jgi:iron complex outermembrane receptor protein
MLSKSRVVIVTLLCLLRIDPGLADDLTSEEAFFAEIPLTLTATRLPQPAADSPVSTSIIDSEMIRAYGAVELIDVLRLVPGFQVAHPSGERVTLSYHGQVDEFSRRMQVLIDGRSVYSPLLGHVDWATLPLNVEDIERIEVTRGPNAASYGANSFAAVINIITRHSSETLGTRLALENGARGHERYFASHSGRSGAFSYRLSTSYREDHGFDSAEFPDDKNIRMLHFRGDYQLDPFNVIELQFGYNQMRHLDGDTDADDILTDPVRTVKREHSFQLLRWMRDISPDESFKLQFYHNREVVHDDFYTAPLNDLGFAALVGFDLDGTPGNEPDIDVSLGVPLPFSTYVSRYDLEFQHTFKPARQWRVVWGGSLRRDEAGGRLDFNTASSHDTFINKVYRVFAHTEWKPSPEWTINLGALAEKNDITTGIRLSPRISANHHFSPRHTVRLSANRAYRTPTLYEEYAYTTTSSVEGIGLQDLRFSDGGLKPEKITTYELAWLANIPRYRTNLELKLFREEIRDVLTEVKDHNYTDHPLNQALGFTVFDDLLYYTNNGHTDANGVELQLGIRPTDYSRLHLGYTYIKQDGRRLGDINRSGPGSTRFDDTTEEVPRTMTTLQYIHKFEPDLVGSLAYHRYGLYEFEGGDDTGDFSILNFRLAKTLKYGNSNIELAASFQNMLDEYFDYEKEQVFESGVYFSMKVHFD